MSMVNKRQEIPAKKPEVEIKRINYYDMATKNQVFKNIHPFWQSLKINGKFWISILFIIWLITYNGTQGYTLTEGIISFLAAILLGYIVHYVSHAYDFEKLYNNSSWPLIKYIKSKPKVDKVIRKFILYTLDFHDKIHHNSSINRTPFNITMEFLQNIFMEGGILILFSTKTNLSINILGGKFRFNRAILLLWGLIYASVHNINYRFFENSQHRNHHIDPKTNYALDILDILFDTKYDINNIENINFDWGINMVIITFFIIYFKIYL